MKATLDNPDTLKHIISVMKELVVDCVFTFDALGMHAQVMDSSHVSLCVLEWLANDFSTYECENTHTIGVHTLSLDQILKCCKSTDQVHLGIQEDVGNLSVSFINKNDQRKLHFELHLMDIDKETLEVPEAEYPCEIIMPSKYFEELCKTLSTMGDICNVSITHNNITYKVSGDVGNVEITLDNTESQDFQVLSSDSFDNMYSLKYLNLFAKANVLTKQVLLSMADNLPQKIKYTFASNSTLVFFLAPKID